MTTPNIRLETVTTDGSSWRVYGTPDAGPLAGVRLVMAERHSAERAQNVAARLLDREWFWFTHEWIQPYRGGSTDEPYRRSEYFKD